MDQRRSILVFLDEVRAANQPVTSHNILMLARAEELRVGVDLNLNGWKLDRLNYVAFIVKVPIRPNAKIDILPNPLRPFVPGEESPPSIGPRRVDSIAASFGFDDKTASELGQQKTLSVIPANLSRTVMYNELVHIASKCGVKPDKDVPETVLVLNGFFQSATMSRLFRRTLTKKTQYMSIGADLNSLISRWALRPIWKTGGLVTFSPTFFLFQHDRLNDIMKVVRSAPNWAAYIVPTTLLYVDEAIEQNKALDPNSAFAALTRALFLDDNNRRIAGEISSDTGGIVVSAAPPLLALKQPCEKWVKWLDDIFACTEHAPLLDLCRQWARTWGHRQTGLTIEEVEKISIGDMIKMRTLPHVVPYRRCIYVGSINDDLIREAHASGIDVISPDAFFSTYMASV
ncbi:hypothetical protein CC85DRAFT_290426 [Cutaneotrichosporon oleaginosum]|uniref:Uncharacterized protein n=1 Tax=Cutaneotrichosporon oleaginosum TaxID=879819 RepID=A0A0J0XW16_9TREE|nr:uncharacterized protein CC85DRAFT_290426 [Cutaneotrichosporon oleaginosum]KLT45233.1 hypothetical protein CC85DRAFT_290426 [Cutaneotrichosporon oleaginosum]TXT14934.1 hypothetical protein COLE_01127 [Cutaneotrichosporon oleaginosum]